MKYVKPETPSDLNISLKYRTGKFLKVYFGLQAHQITKTPKYFKSL
jgi:hypothetical protein